MQNAVKSIDVRQCAKKYVLNAKFPFDNLQVILPIFIQCSCKHFLTSIGIYTYTHIYTYIDELVCLHMFWQHLKNTLVTC